MGGESPAVRRRTRAEALRRAADRLRAVRPQSSGETVLLADVRNALSRVADEIDAEPEFPPAIRADGSHAYTSTYCLHGQHGACRRVCKSCPAPCECDCGHHDLPPSGGLTPDTAVNNGPQGPATERLHP